MADGIVRAQSQVARTAGAVRPYSLEAKGLSAAWGDGFVIAYQALTAVAQSYDTLDTVLALFAQQTA